MTESSQGILDEVRLSLTQKRNNQLFSVLDLLVAYEPHFLCFSQNRALPPPNMALSKLFVSALEPVKLEEKCCHGDS